ncbi:hypothetical protein JVU11DRAFT_6384 [Chiua virens]|nr:hypothetical protein JVU11DRAFT_6384 [Chiua virens]
MPSPEEGYDHIIYLRPEDHPRPEYTREDVLSILQRLKASTRDAANDTIQRSTPYFGHSGGYNRAGQTRGSRGGGRGHRGFSPARGTLYGPSRFTNRARGTISSNWRRSSPGVVTDREGLEGPDRRHAATARVPPMESSKARDSAEERHNSS